MRTKALRSASVTLLAFSGVQALKSADSPKEVTVSPSPERARCPTNYPDNDHELDCLIQAAKLPPIQRLTCIIEGTQRPLTALGYTVPDLPADSRASVVIDWGELVVDIDVSGFPRDEHYRRRIDPESSIIEPNPSLQNIWLSWEDERSRGRSIRDKTYLTYTPSKHECAMQIEPSTGWPPGSYGADHFTDYRYLANFVCHEAG